MSLDCNSDPSVLVAICSRNPRINVLTEVLNALATQTFRDFRTIIVNNGDDESKFRELLSFHNFSIINEPRLGNSYARFTALGNCKEDLMIFVDDDNILSESYVENARDLYLRHPNWGVFGGQQIHSDDLVVPRRKKRFLPYLAIRSLGELEITSPASLEWASIEPVGAGMCLNKKVVDEFLKSNRIEDYFKLGRSGKKLLSGEDSFIARHSYFCGMDYGYSPNLVLVHKIKPERLKSTYLFKLLFNYGRSDVRLNKALTSEEATKAVKKEEFTSKDLFYFLFSKRTMTGALRILGAIWEKRKANAD